jgi:hypothetical protein
VGNFVVLDAANMIYILSGDIGSGKTLHALEWMKHAVFAGRPVFTNIQLLPLCPFHDQVYFMDDVEWPVLVGEGPGDPSYKAWWHFTPPGSLVIVDEADLYFDCGEHSRLGKDVKSVHKMIRKIEVDIVYIVQNIKNLYVRIRRLASRFIVCEWTYRTSPLFTYMPKSFSRFIRSEFMDDTLTMHSRDGHISYREASLMFGWYRTKQLLGDLSIYRNRWLQEASKAEEADAESSHDSTAA